MLQEDDSTVQIQSIWHRRTLPFVNPSTLKSVKIPVPSIALQRQFAHVVHRFERLRARQREVERQALLPRASRGEL